MTEALVMSLTFVLSTVIIPAFWEPSLGNKYAFYLAPPRASLWKTEGMRLSHSLSTSKNETSFLRHCGFLQNAYSGLQSDCKPTLSSDPEEQSHMEPWATTSLQTNWTDHRIAHAAAFGPAWAGQDIMRTVPPEASGRKPQGRLEVSLKVLHSGIKKIRGESTKGKTTFIVFTIGIS